MDRYISSAKYVAIHVWFLERKDLLLSADGLGLCVRVQPQC